MELSINRVRAPLRAPFAAAWGSVYERELVLVRVQDRFGNVGWGEAAPLAGYEGASVEEVVVALEHCGELLSCREDSSPQELLAACAQAALLPQAVAATDLALWDLFGRRQGAPVWKLLGGSAAAEVAVNATIAAEDPSLAAAEAARARAAGFGCVKLKVGLGEDADRVAAVRDAVGLRTAIRLDANGAWPTEQAIAALGELAHFGVELCEEPVHGLEAIGRVAAESAVPVALDESAGLPGALEQRACDAVCLKLGRCGGLWGLVAAASRARKVGYRVYLGSTLDGPLGIAAALHAAAVVRPDLPCGLATLSLFDGRPDPLPAARGLLRAPSGPGLGDGLLEWYR